MDLYAILRRNGWATPEDLEAAAARSTVEAIRAHAAASDLPVDEVVPVVDTVIVRPDPAPVEA